MQLNEVDVEAEFLKTSDASCDVACLMYDSSDPHSFDYCASIYKVGRHIVCVCIMIIWIIVTVSAQRSLLFLIYRYRLNVCFSFNLCSNIESFSRILYLLLMQCVPDLVIKMFG